MAVQKTLKTLDRALSKAGLGSRTEARSWIGAGRVSVNGRVIQTPDHWVDIQRDKIAFDGKPIHQREKIYLLLYKPKGYLTTYKDPKTYLVKCATLLLDEQIERLRSGVELSDGPTKPAAVQRIRDAGKHSF